VEHARHDARQGEEPELLQQEYEHDPKDGP
jgi:hypothetical protein